MIPQVVGPVLPHAKGTKPFRMPERCPLCDTPIVKPEGEVMHRCPNRACPSRGLETLNNWVMAAADIEGVGEQFVRRLWDLGLLRSLPDLYRLTKEQLLELDGFAGEERVERDRRDRGVEAAPVPARAVRAEHPGRGLGDGAEPGAALRLDRRAARRAAPDELMECEGIGPDRAEAIAEWFADDDNRALIEELRAIPLVLEADEGDRPVEGPLTGKQYVITGTLESFTREEAKEALEALGAKVSDGVSKKTAGVIVGESPGVEGREGGGGGRAAAHRGRPARAARGLALLGVGPGRRCGARYLPIRCHPGADGHAHAGHDLDGHVRER